MQVAGFHIHFSGVTQGVGFRPFVQRLADQLDVSGTTWNSADGVHIELNCELALAESFIQEVLASPPRGAYISDHHVEACTLTARTGFKILKSPEDGLAAALLPPDVALCDSCRSELHTPTNRRYNFPFITCTYCGPRYSIIEHLPYDRQRTSMDAFKQCSSCLGEYTNPLDRRFHSQTNSCVDCGPQIQLVSELPREYEDSIDQLAVWLKSGKIAAVKGAAGYLLLCDATNAEAIKNLRYRKQRPSKPFAILYSSMEAIEQDVELHEPARAALNSAISPIVILPAKETIHQRLAFSEIAPGLQEIGVMFPAAPLLELISKASGRPLVATSGNVSGSPIIATNKKAEELLAEVADCFLHHNREVLQPQDDSVVRFSQLECRPIWLRRARGLAPLFFADCSGVEDGQNYLAMGSDLKHTFAIRQYGNTFISPFLGDLVNYESQQAASNCLEKFLFNSLQTSGARKLPARIIVDAHPSYISTQNGEEISQKIGATKYKVQHHEAHFAALLAEHKIDEFRDDVLGIIWDGTGYGNDGQIWGGEFLNYQGDELKRVTHLAYFTQLLGDKMSKEPRLSALSLLSDLILETQEEIGSSKPAEVQEIKKAFSSKEWNLYQRLLTQPKPVLCSSIGRLFDAVAAILGLSYKTSFEGGAALLLEQLARTYQRKHGWLNKSVPPWPVPDYLQAKDWLKLLLTEHLAGQEPGLSALKFHAQCIAMIKQVADSGNYRRLAFSGGVWQNTLLVDLVDYMLADDYDLLFHKQLSPNDENISFGQLAVARQTANDKLLLTSTIVS